MAAGSWSTTRFGDIPPVLDADCSVGSFDFSAGSICFLDSTHIIANYFVPDSLGRRSPVGCTQLITSGALSSTQVTFRRRHGWEVVWRDTVFPIIMSSLLRGLPAPSIQTPDEMRAWSRNFLHQVVVPVARASRSTQWGFRQVLRHADGIVLGAITSEGLFHSMDRMVVPLAACVSGLLFLMHCDLFRGRKAVLQFVAFCPVPRRD